jgi:threonine dehydratase
MARTTDYSRPTTPEDGVNGTNGSVTPRTPKQTSGLALTEYSANPSPPLENPLSKAQKAIPEAYILPNGTPDVRHTLVAYSFEEQELILLAVFTIDTHVSRL